MKRLIILSLLTVSSFSVFCQEKTIDIKYRRSSLYTLMIADSERLYSEVIQKSFIDSPIPDKFNNHIIHERTISKVNDISLSKEELKQAISEYLNTTEIAKEMVSKWFNRDSQGRFNMELIADRGLYNASELDVTIADSNERGMALLADAGEELIKNTFVVVNDFKYTNKEEIAKKAKKVIGIASKYINKNGLGNTIANKTLDVAGKGYVIKTTSHLYQLVWNEEIATIFYNEYWIDETNVGAVRKDAFDKSNIFKLKLIGTEVAWADLQSTSFTEKSEEELIAIATVKAVDAVIAKLQRKYEVFRTKTPLLSGDPLSAQIGLKEGLEVGDKYEVLEQVISKNGMTIYKKQGVIKVDKNQIWDNRYMASEDQDAKEETKKYTLFKGAKNYYSGMLIRQIN